MANDKKKFEENMNSPENKELTQKQREAASNPEEAKDSEKQGVQNVAESAGQDQELSAEQQQQKEDAHHEGHLTPNRLNFNQYDNTAEQYDKAKGTPADPDLKDSPESPITDAKNTSVDTGVDSRTGEQARVGTGGDDNYTTGEPEEEDKQVTTGETEESKRKRGK